MNDKQKQKLQTLKDMKLSREEAETVISWMKGDKYALVYTDDARIATKLLKDERFVYVPGNQIGFEFRVLKTIVARPVVR